MANIEVIQFTCDRCNKDVKEDEVQVAEINVTPYKRRGRKPSPRVLDLCQSCTVDLNIFLRPKKRG